jgi:hypothetical protein
MNFKFALILSFSIVLIGCFISITSGTKEGANEITVERFIGNWRLDTIKYDDTVYQSTDNIKDRYIYMFQEYDSLVTKYYMKYGEYFDLKWEITSDQEITFMSPSRDTTTYTPFFASDSLLYLNISGVENGVSWIDSYVYKKIP